MFDTASRIVRAAEAKKIKLRLFGAIACWDFAAECRGLPGFYRARSLDIDFVSDCNSEENITTAFSQSNFAKLRTDSFQGGFKLNFQSILPTTEEMTAHVYSGKLLRLNHPLKVNVSPFNGTISLNPTDLLLTKIAINQFTEKDRLDCAMVLHDLPIDSKTSKSINSEQLAMRCSNGWRAWGLFEDVRQNLENVIAYARKKTDFSDEQRKKIVDQANLLVSKLQGFPKPFTWRIRAQFGRRLQWFDEVDDSE